MDVSYHNNSNSKHTTPKFKRNLQTFIEILKTFSKQT
jgi:hypothetical protein